MITLSILLKYIYIYVTLNVVQSVYICECIFFIYVCAVGCQRNRFIEAGLCSPQHRVRCNFFYVFLKQGYRYHKLRKTFSKFYRRYYDLISKFQVGLKSLLRQGLSEPDFYGDLVYKLKKIVGSNNFSAQFIKIISHYKKIGYNINVLQQTACLVVNPITVGNFAFLFNCMPVGRTSDSMMVPT